MGGRMQSLLIFAFGSAVAMVDTALLNRRATRASALPTNRQICGGPEMPWNWFGSITCRLRLVYVSFTSRLRVLPLNTR